MIDYIFLFANLAAAIADPTVGAYYNNGWRMDVCNPGIKVVTAAALVNGVSPITGYWIMIESTGPSAALSSNSKLVLVLDRDAAVRSKSFVVAAAISGANRTNATISVVPLGSQYPQPLGQ